MKPTTSESQTTQQVMEKFLAELLILRGRATAVAKLRRGTLFKGLAALNENGGQLQAKVLRLMDEIEADFRIISRPCKTTTRRMNTHFPA